YSKSLPLSVLNP
uniref:Antimicrobial protein AN5-1 n=1 Tax=Paenibacillus alvei TaxID=44250 RepID=AMP1_PAEAL|nr:RecName: Full=Antimicrobial protein AN5-1 [Paenibacillus alvei]